MELNEEIYLNCGIYEDSKGKSLFIAIPGYFASTAWCQSDEAYNNISGTKFEALTGDDNKIYNLDRWRIRRLTLEDNIDELLENCQEDFKEKFIENFNI